MLEALVSALVGTVLLSPAVAQTASRKSDAIVLVQPMGSRAMVAVAYAGPRPHAAVRDQMKKLAAEAGWTITTLDIADEQIHTSPGFGSTKSLGKQTSATALLQNAPQARGGGFVLQPYLNAFSDLNRIEILYFVPPDPTFQGLREFESSRLSVRLTKAGGPYQYVVDIRDHSGPLPTVPLIQPAPRAGNPVRAAGVRRSTGLDASALALVLAIAAGAGLVVLIVGLAVHNRQKPPQTRQRLDKRAQRMSRT